MDAEKIQQNNERMSADLFNRFVELIYDVSGIRFNESKAYFLNSKLGNRRRALGLKTLEDYYRLLQQPHAKATEYPNLLNEITINETFFFRNMPQLEAFEKDVLQPMVTEKRKNGDRQLRIWSAATSTGDEAYTTALQLLMMEGAQDFNIQIIGTDISRRALDVAQKGAYGHYAIRNVPESVLNRFFTQTGNNTYQINDSVKKLVTFREANLLDATTIKPLGTFDIIFCRNVLIYFDTAARRKVLENIATTMRDDSLLLTGHSENLYAFRDIFRGVKDKQRALAYQKTPDRSARMKELGLDDLIKEKQASN